ncbi:MAG: ParB/RepB/Spo0J family partition protein [Phycisphaerales bacterium]|nr:ParB/RepB/Spo0J family partition protein [Phycisphaerales bacterium]
MASPTSVSRGDEVRSVPLGDLAPNRHQPRTHFDDPSLDELAASIRQHGILQPIVARLSASRGGKYEIVAGERRWRAAQKAGLSAIPVVVREVTEQESAEWALVENLQREDLNAMERAHAFARLGKEFGLSTAQIADRVGLDRSSVANFIRLIELEPEVQDLVRNDRISFGHGRALLAVPSGPGRIALARDAAAGEWSVRRTERAAAAISQVHRGPKAAAAAPTAVAGDQGSAAIRLDLERRVGEYLGTRVSIREDGRGSTGRVIIEFYTNEHFEGLLARIGFQV